MTLLCIDNPPVDRPATEQEYQRLEEGDVFYFSILPFEIPEANRQSLLAQKQAPRFHKNISYRPDTDRLKGVDADDRQALERMHEIMREYSRRAIEFCARFLPRYAGQWRVDYASFRPIEEHGRQVKFNARNDLIHVDSFPSRPSQGNRLLRIFTNIHPQRDRVWVSGGTFSQLAEKYARDAGLPVPPTMWTALGRTAVSLLAQTGLPVIDRSEYDRFMLRFHDYLKRNEQVQRSPANEQWSFPPGSTWMCFTDSTSHACLSGQFALEQTFMVARQSLLAPDQSPIAILERMAGFPLA